MNDGLVRDVLCVTNGPSFTLTAISCRATPAPASVADHVNFTDVAPLLTVEPRTKASVGAVALGPVASTVHAALA